MIHSFEFSLRNDVINLSISPKIYSLSFDEASFVAACYKARWEISQENHPQ